jgi:hypothetical protein
MINLTAKILELHNKWDSADSSVIAGNVENLLIANGLSKQNQRIAELQQVTNSTKHTVYAWFNQSRKDVKIPFLKLCMIAEKYNTNIETLLK